ncbi:LPD1 domain-containing protein [Cupriavidus sp. TMH.W2]|uniref:LPD1 domain-containing protein n=1 Tax=Cupriavidus sp. TMH.W2 TaxID=3434465 RepID=UPI003D77DA53
MADPSVRKHWWPELTRFGARLSVAHNPSVGRNFLKLAIFDREQFARESGFAPGEDLLRVMRACGFAYAASEVKSAADHAHDEAVGQNLPLRETERRVSEAKRRLIFYSPSITEVSEAFLRRFIPNSSTADLKESLLTDIKHHDYQYIDTDVSKRFISRLQHIDGAAPGVYFTIPGDRAAQASIDSAAVSLNVLLDYSDLAQVDGGQPELSGLPALYRDFHPVRAIESAVRAATLGLDGFPLKAPRLKACTVAYPTYDAAMAANGGDIEGIERVEYEWGVPVAFAYPTQRLLVLRDARFLEYNPLRIPEPEMPLAGVQANWTLLRHMNAVRTRFEAMRDAGVLDPEAWKTEDVVNRVDRDFDFIAGAMRLAMQAFDRQTGLVDTATLMGLSGIKPSSFESVFPRDFQHFLTQFRQTLQDALRARKQELAAAQPIQPNVLAVIESVRRRSAPGAAGERVDAGEKIGGARKDLAKQALRLDELPMLNERERAALVKKDNVWTALDYDAMRERGVLPEVAYLIRELRKSFPATPLSGGINVKRDRLERRAKAGLTVQQCENYVRAATLITTELIDVRTLDDLANAYVRIGEAADVLLPQSRSLPRGAWSFDTDHWFCDGTGFRTVKRQLALVKGWRDADGRLHREASNLEDAAKVARAATGGGWDWAIKPDGVGPAAVSPPAKPKKPEPVFEHLDPIRRIGPDYRNGAPFNETVFLARFGFRGIEYGNWLPQAERQIVLDHATDAFCDLARVLGLPEQAMGLGGSLGIGFGSRGNGGKRAAQAHYEPLANAINLTRLNGAGSLAHEWFHALDYWIAKHYDMSGIKPASELPVGATISGRAPAAFAIQRTLSFVNMRDETLPELTRRRCHKARADETQGTHTQLLREDLSRRFRAMERAIPAGGMVPGFGARAEAIMTQMLEAVPPLAEHGIEVFANPNAFLAAIRAAYIEHGGVPESTLPRAILMAIEKGANGLATTVERVLAEVSRFEPGRYKTESNVLRDALYYDSYRSKPYWSTPCEMMARAFEAYVQDEIERHDGQLSQYLVYGCQDKPHAEYSVYPRGAERAAVREAFDDLFTTVRERLTAALTQAKPMPAPDTPEVSGP